MKKMRNIAVGAILALFASAVPSGAVWAAGGSGAVNDNAGGSGATLTLHYYEAAGGYHGHESAFTLTGKAGTQTASSRDGNWLTTTFEFPGAQSEDSLGFTIDGDSAYPTQKRFVQVKAGAAEAWLADGDAQVYAKPEPIDGSLIIKKNLKAYVAVQDLTDQLGLTVKTGTNGYLFDGAGAHTVPILTIYRGRDYFEINTNSNRIGQNVTGNMLRSYTDTVFTDLDGFAQDGKYYLSFSYIQRLFQVGTLVTDRNAFILPRQFVAYDKVQPVGDPATVGFSQGSLEAIDDYVKSQSENGGPSLAYSVVKDGKLVKESASGFALKYATSEVDGKYQPAQLLPKDQWEPATVDTMYDLASNTKMYATNYAIQQLVSEKKLDLNQTLQSFPGWEHYTDSYTEYTGDWTVGGVGGITAEHTGKSTVTVKDLLHHMAGEIPDPQYPNLSVAGDLYYQSSDIHDRSGIIDKISKTPLMVQPHTEFLYSDVDFMILGILVEQITGQTLDAYMQTHFYGPLDLNHTTFNPLTHGFSKNQIAGTELNGNTRDGNVSFGTFPDGSAVPMRHYTLQGQVQDEKAWYSMGGVSGHAGLFSNVSDMAVLTQLMLNGGLYNGKQYFTKAVADEFTTPYAPDPADADSSTIGLGWRVHSKSAAAYYYFNWGPSRSTYGHEGWTGTLTIIDPTYDMTITILTNMRHSPVVDPPNGFADSDFAISNMVPVSARIYNALLSTGTQYSPIASVEPTANASVPRGTSAADAAAALPQTTMVKDSAGVSHPVALTWTLDSTYDGATPGKYDATATFSLPADVVQADPVISLTVSATVTVTVTVKKSSRVTIPMPARPQANDLCGLANDTVTLPASTATVHWKYVRAAGNHMDKRHTIRVRAVAVAGFVFSNGKTSHTWRFHFTNHRCDGTVHLATNAKSQCVNGNAYVAVYARNTGEVKTNVRLTVPSCTKKFTSVAPQSAVYQLFDSGAKSIAAGAAVVAGYTWVNGAGSYSTFTAPYSALQCS